MLYRKAFSKFFLLARTCTDMSYSGFKRNTKCNWKQNNYVAQHPLVIYISTPNYTVTNREDNSAQLSYSEQS